MHAYKILEKGKPLAQAKKALILIHGRGGSAHDIISLADEFCDDSFYIAAPQATNHTWYPYGFMVDEASNEPWLTSAVNTVKRLMDDIGKHIAAENLYIMGFSQGACLTLEVSARFADKFGGVAAFTGGLIGKQLVPSRYADNFKGTKIFLGNSDIDPHIPVHRSEDSRKILIEKGADVVLKIYPNMPHTINRDEIETVKKWMF